uniref:Cellodextrin-phosphorylase n=1 Tax=Thermoclostridium stercorarium TaxID=1510 RepID=P77846_THEST|nr:cellodextrin-phosphorylase [Thermoclostridium stercorarium]
MRYGYFDEKAREYVITRPDTPTPWINYIGNGKYGGIVTNTGGGYSFHKDPQNRRITRYRYNNLPTDRPGRYIYVRDRLTGEYWNPGYQPVQRKLDSYRCRHGMGYTVLEGEYKGIAADVTYFVPDDRDFEIWLVQIRNLCHVERNLQVFSYAEFCFWDAIMDQQNVDWVQQINQGRYEDRLITWHPHHFKDACAFFATNAEINSFDTNLEAFIGRYRCESNPIAVETGACSNSVSYRMNGVGAFCIDVNLKPGEEREIIFILGFTENKSTIRDEIRDYLNVEYAKEALKRLKDSWEEYLDKLQIETPDRETNLFVNTWNQYQCKITFNWSRFVSMYSWGLGRGIGIRDSAQDTLGVMHSIPELAGGLIKRLIHCQYTDGRVYHLFFPLTGEGGIGDAPVVKFDWYSDDHLWLPIAANAYLKETANFDFFQSVVPYNDNKTEGTVWEHLNRAMEFTYNHRGPHALPYSRADWNDTLNLDMGNGIAETLFTSMLFSEPPLKRFRCRISDKRIATKYRYWYDEMKQAINEWCWDGEWYIRAFDDEGNVLGSGKNRYGKIFINSQSWAVLSMVAPEEYAKKCLESVYRHLNTKYGIVKVYPAYPEYNPKIGGMTTYPPGAKENGGIFAHTNPWVMIAECMMGNGRRAYQYYRQILPLTRNDDADLLEVEPYVYCQNILGKEHPQFGIGRNSWLTGTAAWNMVAVSQYILGIRPEYDGLTVDPCIPPDWKGFKVRRIFRGCVYNIEVRNPEGVRRCEKNCRRGVETDKIPVKPAGTVCECVVIMG